MKRYEPISIEDIGVENNKYKWTLWDNKRNDDLYYTYAYRTKKQAQEECDNANNNNIALDYYLD